MSHLTSRVGRNAIVFSVLISLSASALPVRAEQMLNSPKDAIAVTLNTPLSDKTSKAGDAFEGVVKDDHRFRQRTLPAGSVLQGKVHIARPSKTFNRAGFVRLDVQKIVLPSGETYAFKRLVPAYRHEPPSQGLETERIYHPEAVTFKDNLVRNMIPFGVVSGGTSIPLGTATNLPGGVIFSISLGARMLLGVLLEYTKTERAWHDRRHQSWPTRYGHGLLRGTGLVTMYYFFRPAPNMNYPVGSTVPLAFNKKEMESLFKVADTSTNNAGATPVAPATAAF